MRRQPYWALTIVAWLSLPLTSDLSRAAGQTTQPKKLDDTIAELRDAIRLRPDSDKAHHDLANALLAKGDLDGAIASFREALRLNPRYASAFDGLGVAL